MNDYQEKNDRLVRKWFDKWAGGTAVLWEYAVSHRMLVLRITFIGTPGNLHVSCGDTRYICGPVQWEGARLELDLEFGDSDGPIYVVRDTTARFMVRCGLVGVAENVKPVF